MEDLRPEEVQVFEDGQDVRRAVVPARSGTGRAARLATAGGGRRAGRRASREARRAGTGRRRGPGQRDRSRLRPARPAGGEERARRRPRGGRPLLSERIRLRGLQGRAGPPHPPTLHGRSEEPPGGHREGDDGHRPGARPGAARGVRQRHRGGLLDRPEGASRREGEGPRLSVSRDGSPDAPLHGLRDAGGPGPGLAPAAPRDRARPLPRPGPEDTPLLLRGPGRSADGRGALPDDREHGQPLERVGLRFRRARSARPLAHGRDEAGARPGPRHRLFRADERRPYPTLPCPR